MDFKIGLHHKKEGWSQSELTTGDDCWYKWYLKYDRLLDPAEANIKFAVGTAWHKIMEDIYNSKGKGFSAPHCEYEGNPHLSSEREALLEQWDKILTVYAEEYLILYKDDFANLQIESVEEEVAHKIDLDGMEILLRGKIDLQVMFGKQFQVWDHKSTAGMNAALLRGWDFKFQFMFYIWLVTQTLKGKKVGKFIVNAMIKPTKRVKINQSLQGYLAELRKDIRCEPKKFFHREPLLLTEGKLDRFESNILMPKLNRIALLQDSETPQVVLSALLAPNTVSCMNFGEYCPFFDLCEHKIDPSRFEKRQQKHTELYT